MAEETTLAKLRTLAERSGLSLSEEELAKLLPGINRSHTQILELRELMTDRLEPAATFVASRTETR
jgi:Asp-tRNA(Asn)/Glu-tRNA(Gln) amidotransferase C subunit